MNIIHSDQAPVSGPYSQAVSHNGILCYSGQIAPGSDGSDHTKTPNTRTDASCVGKPQSSTGGRRFFSRACTKVIFWLIWTIFKL